jgi:hypothetical protein
MNENTIEDLSDLPDLEKTLIDSSTISNPDAVESAFKTLTPAQLEIILNIITDTMQAQSETHTEILKPSRKKTYTTMPRFNLSQGDIDVAMSVSAMQVAQDPKLLVGMLNRLFPHVQKNVLKKIHKQFPDVFTKET